jgi:nicotinate-nucleotide adenylyltransferase
MRIGVFGGTFNPVHYGHLRAAEEVCEALEFSKILFIPSGNPPLKRKDIADSAHRYKMLRLATAKNNRFDVLDIECKRKGKSYTVKTLEMLHKEYYNANLYFILGIDAFLDIPNWWKPEKLMHITNFAVISRPGCKFMSLTSSPYIDIKKNILRELDDGSAGSFIFTLKTNKKIALVSVTGIAFSSTEIRKRIKEGFSIKYMLPDNVESYIISNKTY